MKKVLLLGTALALACGLMLGSIGSVLAVANSGGRGLFGTVDNVSISDDGTGTITLTNVKPAATADNATTIEINVTDNTTYHIPSVTFVPTQRWQTWQQLTPESRKLVQEAKRVAVLLAQPVADRVAVKVMVVPVGGIAYRYHHQLGVVVTVAGDNATIAKRNGEQITVTIGDGVDVAVGQFVILVTDSSGGTQLKAIQAYRVDRIADRFEGYLEGSLTEQDFDHATAQLQQAHDRHMTVLEGIKAKLEGQDRAQAAAMVQKAMDYSEARYSEVIQIREQIKERIDAVGWDQWKTQWAVIQGTITSVDTAVGNRTVAMSTDNGTLTLKVAARARIVKDGTLFAISGLKAGEVAEVIYHVPTSEAIYIQVP